VVEHVQVLKRGSGSDDNDGAAKVAEQEGDEKAAIVVRPESEQQRAEEEAPAPWQLRTADLLSLSTACRGLSSPFLSHQSSFNAA
jgi:hypothetical protein